MRLIILINFKNHGISLLGPTRIEVCDVDVASLRNCGFVGYFRRENRLKRHNTNKL